MSNSFTGVLNRFTVLFRENTTYVCVYTICMYVCDCVDQVRVTGCHISARCIIVSLHSCTRSSSVCKVITNSSFSCLPSIIQSIHTFLEANLIHGKMRYFAMFFFWKYAQIHGTFTERVREIHGSHNRDQIIRAMYMIHAKTVMIRASEIFSNAFVEVFVN